MSKVGSEYEGLSFGKYGRTKIDSSGTDTATGNFVAVKAISTDFTYGTGCVAKEGDAPDNGDALVQGDVDLWPASTVVAGTGSAWVYYEREQ